MKGSEKRHTMSALPCLHGLSYGFCIRDPPLHFRFVSCAMVLMLNIVRVPAIESLLSSAVVKSSTGDRAEIEMQKVTFSGLMNYRL